MEQSGKTSFDIMLEAASQTIPMVILTKVEIIIDDKSFSVILNNN